MSAVIRRFGAAIPPHGRDEIMNAAMFRCLRRHRGDLRRLTSSLHEFTEWECYNFVRSRSRAEERFVSLADVDEPASPATPHADDIECVYECMNVMDEWEREIVIQYYIFGMTLREIGRENGYSHTAARDRLTRALDRLRTLCTARGN
jgi:RNA polymerase sigma factor (sigma-70 family)